MTPTTVRAPHKFHPKRLPMRLSCLLAVVALSAFAKTFLFSPIPRGAYPVLSTAQWTSRAPQDTYPYQWLPNGDLAYLARDANGMAQVCYQKMDVNGPVGAIRHGPELPFDSRISNFFVSPDEQRVAYIQYTNPTKWKTTLIYIKTFLISADGKTTRQPFNYFLGWLADSRSYLAESFLPSAETRVYHLDSPRSEIIPRTSPNHYPMPITLLTTSRSFLMGTNFTGMNSEWGGPVDYPQMTVRSFSMSNPAITEQTWHATVPSGMDFGTACASPDNRYLLWKVGKRQSAPLDKWLMRLNPKWHSKTTYVMYSFLSDLHGNHMRPIFTNAMGGPLTLTPTWTPDSKHVSFIYKEKLYLAPVE